MATMNLTLAASAVSRVAIGISRFSIYSATSTSGSAAVAPAARRAGDAYGLDLALETLDARIMRRAPRYAGGPAQSDRFSVAARTSPLWP